MVVIGGWSLEAFTGVRPDSQVWVRRDARSPWVLDVPFTPDSGGRWTNKRHIEPTEDLEDLTWVAADGLRYARPEVTLLFKAGLARETDRRDADVALPLLDGRARRWLCEALATHGPRPCVAERTLRPTEAIEQPGLTSSPEQPRLTP